MKKIFYAFLSLLDTLLRRIRNRIVPVFLIFLQDVKKIFKNRATVIIIIGLCLLPSLYAWINIYACWDPYSKIGNLPVAIVNKDQGAVFNGKVVNVGDNVIEELKKNKSIGWDFVDEWQASYGLNEGKYYALIEIPDNFTARLLTLTSSTPQKPQITYRVNEKLNSIATKITDAAKNKLVDNIKSNFVKTVTTEAIGILKAEMKSSDVDMSEMGGLTDTLTQMNDDIGKLKQYIETTNEDSERFQTFITTCSAKLPLINDQIDSLQNILEADKSLARKTERTIESVSNDLNTDVQQLAILDGYNQQIIVALKQVNGNGIDKDTIGIMEQCSGICASTDILLKADAANISSINKDYNLSGLTLAGDTLTYMDSLVLSEKQALDTQIPILSADTSKSSIDAALTSLSGISTELSKRLITLSGEVQSNAIPMLNALVSDFEIELDDAVNLSELSRALVPQLEALAVFSTASGKLTASQTSALSGKLTDIQKSLDTLISKLNGLSNDDLNYLNELMNRPPDEIADFISSPIKVKEVDIYSTDTFGEGLTPFYTVLAIWIGALLSCALLSVNCKLQVIKGYKLNFVQRHYGRMLLFLCISLVQSTIITLGDVYILGVTPADFPLMLALSALTSMVFTVIIFTTVSLMGNVGKAIVVVMMVFQIAGAGGIYPIQTNPEIFGLLEPLWPFTYAIDYFREAIAGPLENSVAFNVRAMLIFTGVYLVLAILKKPFHKLNEFFEEIYKRAEI